MEPERWDNRRFAAFIEAELRRREWLQADLARKIGVRNGTLSRWMTGDRRPSSESALRIADALNADPDALLAMTGHREESGPSAQDDQIARIVSLLKRVDLGVGYRGDGLEEMISRWIELDRRDRAQQRAEEG